jgi:hypothetical protein
MQAEQGGSCGSSSPVSAGPMYLQDEQGDNAPHLIYRDGDGMITSYAGASGEGEQRIDSLPVQLAARLFCKSEQIQQKLAEGTSQTIIVAGGGGRDAQQGMFAAMSAARNWLQSMPKYATARPPSYGRIVIEIYSTEFLNSNDERGENFMEWTTLIRDKTEKPSATGDVTAEHSTFLKLFKTEMHDWAEVRVKNFPLHGDNDRFGKACRQLKNEIEDSDKDIISALMFETGADMQLTLRAVFRVDNIDDTMMLQLFHKWLRHDVEIVYTLCNTFLDYRSWPSLQKIMQMGAAVVSRTNFYLPTAPSSCVELREGKVWEDDAQMQKIADFIQKNWALRFMLHEWKVEAESGRNGTVDVSLMNQAELCFAFGKSNVNPLYLTANFDRIKLEKSPHKFYFDKTFVLAQQIASSRSVGSEMAVDDVKYSDYIAAVTHMRLTETEDANLPRPPSNFDLGCNDAAIQVRWFETRFKHQIYIGCFAYYRMLELIRRQGGEEPSTEKWQHFLKNGATIASFVANARVGGARTYQMPGSVNPEGSFEPFPQTAYLKQWGAPCFDVMMWLMYLGHDEALDRLLEWRVHSDQYLDQPQGDANDNAVVKKHLQTLRKTAASVTEYEGDDCPLTAALQATTEAGEGSDKECGLISQHSQHVFIFGDAAGEVSKIFIGGRGQGWTGEKMELLSSWQQYDALASSIAGEYMQSMNSGSTTEGEREGTRLIQSMNSGSTTEIRSTPLPAPSPL